jgi:transposase
MVAADARTAITFSLSAGQAHDAVEGRKILKQLAGNQTIKYVIMDKAYEGEETRQLVMDLNFEAVVPPKSNRVEPWQYNKEMYKQRNEVERLFRRLKGFRRIFSRFDKLDVVFTFFIFFALFIESLK